MCHVVNCKSKNNVKVIWVPEYGVSVEFCAAHNPPELDDVIDLARAREDHANTLSSFAEHVGFKG